MTTETPAQLLRRGAAHLRQLADAATPPPWTAVARYRKGTDVIVQYDIHKPPPPGSNIPQKKNAHPSRAADALYGVAMHPGVGSALADWLDAVAAEAESHAAHGYGNEQSEITDGHPMAVALAILGETS